MLKPSIRNRSRRRWLLPGAAEDLLAKLEHGLANPFEDWRIAVWGPLGVDGGPPMVSVANLVESVRVHNRPAAAAPAPNDADWETF